MKRYFYYSLGGLSLYVLFLIVLIPAHVVLHYLPIPQQISLQGIHGTIWKGGVTQARFYDQSVQHLQWQIPYQSLLTLMPKIDFQSGTNSELEAQGVVGYSLWSQTAFFNNVNATIDVPWIQKKFQPQAPIHVEGRLSIHLKKGSWNLQGIKGLEGDIQWQNARIHLPANALDLGTPNITLHNIDEQVLFDVNVHSQALELLGKAKLNTNGAYEFDGTLTPKNDFPQRMRAALPMLLGAEQEGVYSLRYQGHLS